MLSLFACLVGIFAILVFAEVLTEHKFLAGEHKRKFVHMLTGFFIAFWPWFVSLRTITIIGAAMVAIVLINRVIILFDYHSLKRATFGDLFFALAILLCSLLTSSKLFFALAILNMSLADGVAAIIGQKHLKKWSYKIRGYKKTIVGSMTVWVVSLLIVGTGLLFSHGGVNFNNYFLVLVLLPPILTVLEGISIYGLDNLLLPLATVVALNLAH